MKTTKPFTVVLLLALLAGCGSGSSNPTTPRPSAQTLAAAAVPKSVATVKVNEDHRQGAAAGEYLADVTIQTTAGEEINLEYCDIPVKPGDRIDLVPYGVGTTLIYVNEVLVGSVTDWKAYEEHIRNPDPEREQQAYDAWEAWKTAHPAVDTQAGGEESA